MMNTDAISDSYSVASVVTDHYDELDFEEEIDQPIELDYETGLMKTSSVKTLSSASVVRNSNDSATAGKSRMDGSQSYRTTTVLSEIISIHRSCVYEQM